jgi:hypothetical protein
MLTLIFIALCFIIILLFCVERRLAFIQMDHTMYVKRLLDAYENAQRKQDAREAARAFAESPLGKGLAAWKEQREALAREKATTNPDDGEES